MTDLGTSPTTPDLCEELPKGTELMMGQYTITDYLNHGGFGITYVAKDSFDRRVVVKECFPGTLCRRSRLAVQARSRAHTNELEGVIKLFVREAHALSKLEHPSIVGVHQVFEDHGTAYMVLDYIEGSDLLTYAEKTAGVLPATDIKEILEKILDAIGFVHNAGLLHRDISPDNIILTHDKSPILIDFGAAREQASKATQALSALRVVKDGYSPQEFYLAGSEQGPSSDLYSLAATFYHIITGEAPPDSQRRITAHVGDDPDPYVPLAQRTDAFDATFCAAIDKALAVLPKDRLQSAADWKKAMQTPKTPPKQKRISTGPSRILSRAAQARPMPQRLKKKRSGVQKSTIAATVAAVSVLAGGALFSYDQAPPAENPATLEAEIIPADQASLSEERVTVIAAPVEVQTNAEPLQSRLDAIKVADLGRSWSDGRIDLSWSVVAPFVVSEDGAVTGIDSALPTGFEGSVLLSVGGTSYSGPESLTQAFQSAAESSNGANVSLELSLRDQETSAESSLTVFADIVYQTRLDTGLTFETRATDDMWVTTVMTLPSASETSLRVGDQLAAIIPENVRLLGGDSLAQILASAIDAGKDKVEFAIRRNGTLWTAHVRMTGETG